MPVSEAVRRAFAAFEEPEGATPDFDRALSLYADTFMFGSRDGVQPVQKAPFAAALPKRHAFFKSLGHRATRIASLHETRLDERYVAVRAQIEMHFERPGEPAFTLDLDTTFVLYTGGATPVAITQIEHDDALNIMRERDLLPAGV